jgi:hypothetical protein
MSTPFSRCPQRCTAGHERLLELGSRTLHEPDLLRHRNPREVFQVVSMVKHLMMKLEVGWILAVFFQAGGASLPIPLCGSDY